MEPKGLRPPRKGNGDAVEAHARNGGDRRLPILDAGQIVQACAHTGKAARDDHRKDDVAVFLHAAVLRSVKVEAGRLQLIAELRLVQDDPNEDRHEDSKRDGNGHGLLACKQLAQAEARDESRGVSRRQGLRIGAVRVLDRCQDQVRQIQGDQLSMMPEMTTLTLQ